MTLTVINIYIYKLKYGLLSFADHHLWSYHRSKAKVHDVSFSMTWVKGRQQKVSLLPIRPYNNIFGTCWLSSETMCSTSSPRAFDLWSRAQTVVRVCVHRTVLMKSVLRSEFELVHKPVSVHTLTARLHQNHLRLNRVSVWKHEYSGTRVHKGQFVSLLLHAKPPKCTPVCEIMFVGKVLVGYSI